MVFLGKQSLYGAAVPQNTDHKRTNFALGTPLAVILFPVLNPGQICVLVRRRGTEIHSPSEPGQAR
jgi:hypothetical protein